VLREKSRSIIRGFFMAFKKSIVPMFIISVLLIAVSFCFAAIPEIIGYEGRLTDQYGTPITTPTQFTFKIWDDATATGAGHIKCTSIETITPDSSGVFSTVIDVPDPVFDGTDRWLGVAIGTDSEMTPRIRVASAPYAYKALSADNAATGPRGATGATGPKGDTGGGGTSYWASANGGTDIYNTNHSTGKVGIGTTAPGATLQVVGQVMLGSSYHDSNQGTYAVAMGNQHRANGNYSVAMGQYNSSGGPYSVAMGSGTSTEGSASVTMGIGTWSHGTASTAMGFGSVSQGDYSAAMGEYTTAKGIASTAMGHFTKASGDYSVAMGLWSTAEGSGSAAIGQFISAEGENSFATGYGTRAHGAESTAMGYDSTAMGNYSTALGHYSIALGEASIAMGISTSTGGTAATAMGLETTAGGNYSVAMGQFTTAEGSASVSMGSSTEAIGDGSTAMGHYTHAVGTYSTAMGEYTTALSYGCFVIGRSNASFGSGAPTFWDPGDPVFIIGIGDTMGNQANAVTVMKNGKVGIGTATPQTLLDVVSTREAFMPPRMTQTQRLALSALAGMMVYDTTNHHIYVYNGTTWEAAYH
jgi:hypothetical protein